MCQCARKEELNKERGEREAGEPQYKGGKKVSEMSEELKPEASKSN